MAGHLHDQFDWLEEQKEKVGNAIGSGIQAADNFIDNNIPGGKGWTDDVGRMVQRAGNAANEFTEITDRAVTDPIQSPGDAALFVVGSVRKGIEDFRYGARAVSEAAGFDPRTGDAITFAAEEIATLGAGKLGKTISKLPPPSAPKLVPALAAVRQQTQAKRFGSAIPKGGQVLKAVTVNNPKVLDTTGRRLGEEIIKNDPGLAEHLVKRDKRMQQLENKITQNLEVKEVYKKEGKANPEWKSADRAVKKSRPLLYSERSNVKPFTDDDFQLYGVNNVKTDRNQVDWIANRLEKGKQISEKVHKHHLVTKGGTAAAFEKMEDFIKKGDADPDDLVVMFEYAEKKKAAPGDRLSNNSYILDTPHSEIHQQVLKPAGDEFSQKQWQKILKEVKTPEDLMDWWVDQVDNNYVPNKNTGLIWQDLDDLIKEVQSA